MNNMEETKTINNDNIIKNISYDQSEILYNIMNLYNDGKPFECDITASELKFYKKNIKQKFEIPIPKILMDVYPQRDDIVKITPFKRLPLEDNSISSIVVDLPFVISPHTSPSSTDAKDGSMLIFKRFSGFYPVAEMFENYWWWMSECNRVLKDDGIIVWKSQSTVSGGINYQTEEFSFMCATRLGLYTIDKFYLEAKARLISNAKMKNQCHARKYTSSFYVFKKDSKFGEKNNYFKMIEDYTTNSLENKVWEVK